MNSGSLPNSLTWLFVTLGFVAASIVIALLKRRWPQIGDGWSTSLWMMGLAIGVCAFAASQSPTFDFWWFVSGAIFSSAIQRWLEAFASLRRDEEGAK